MHATGGDAMALEHVRSYRMSTETVEAVESVAASLGCSKSDAIRAAVALAVEVYADEDARRYREPLDALRAYCSRRPKT